jgi:glycosyltransferase involved in cell wall biosynthesis
MNTLITVIPVFNGEKYIAATLQSVAAQTRRPDRLIVLDNCSTDTTEKIAREFRDIPCEWIQNDRNLGLFGNLNRALRFAEETDFLHLLHADDLIRPEFYERCLQELHAATSRALAFCFPAFINEQAQPVRGPTTSTLSRSRLISTRKFIGQRSELRPIYFPGVLLRTAREAAPCAFRADLPQLADHVFWAEWARHCSQVVELPSGLAEYRIHPGSETRRNSGQLEPWVLDEWRAMQMIAALLDEKGVQRWLRIQRLKTVFAARCDVKARMVGPNSPDFAASIRSAARRIAGPGRCVLASIIVRARNLFSFG